jgi:membrane fusion protein (multidrug efflux system)
MNMSNTSEEKTTPVAGKKRFSLPKSRKFRLGATIVGFALCIGLMTPYYLHAISHEETEDAFVEAHVVSISPRIPGHIARVFITDNQLVHKGQLLIELDPSDYEVALTAAEARLRSAEASVQEARATASATRNILIQRQAEIDSQKSGLAQVRAEVAEVRAAHTRDDSDLIRIKKIADAGAVSRQEFDHAKAQADMARAKLHSAQRQVDTHSAQIAQARAGLAAAEDELHRTDAQVEIKLAEMNEAQAEVEQAKLNLSYTRITAPCDGHLTKKAVEPGTYVQVGQKLFSIVSSETWVIANFKETQIAEMRPGQAVEIKVDTYPDTVFHGHVDSIQRGTGSRFSLLPPENATGNFIKVVQRVPVKIVLDNPKSTVLLAPGMSVIPSVDIAAPANTHMYVKSETDKTEIQ